MSEIPPRSDANQPNESNPDNQPRRFNTRRERIGEYSEEEKKERQKKLDDAAAQMREATARFEEDSPEKKRAAAILDEMEKSSESKKEQLAREAEHLRRETDNRSTDQNWYEFRKRMREGDVPEEIARNNPFAKDEWEGKPLSKGTILFENLADRIEDLGVKTKNMWRTVTFREGPNRTAKRKKELDEMVRRGEASLVGTFRLPTREEMMVHPPKKKKKPLAKVLEKSHGSEGNEEENEHELIEAIKEAVGEHQDEKKKPSQIDTRFYKMLKRGDKREYKMLKKQNKKNPESAPDFYHETVGVYNRKGNLVGAIQYRIRNPEKPLENHEENTA